MARRRPVQCGRAGRARQPIPPMRPSTGRRPHPARCRQHRGSSRCRSRGSRHPARRSAPCRWRRPVWHGQASRRLPLTPPRPTRTPTRATSALPPTPCSQHGSMPAPATRQRPAALNGLASRKHGHHALRHPRWAPRTHQRLPHRRWRPAALLPVRRSHRPARASLPSARCCNRRLGLTGRPWGWRMVILNTRYYRPEPRANRAPCWGPALALRRPLASRWPSAQR